MKRYGLLGEHLCHSYSKIIHSMIFKHFNIGASYELIECKEYELKNYVDELKRGTYSGFNVTIPFKKTIMQYLDEIDPKATKIGSVNTIYIRNGKAIGTNTDYDGFFRTLQKYQVNVLNKTCYILGTGGASLAIGQVLKDLGGQCFYVSRTPKGNQIGYQDLESRQIDVLVNTTPVGMFPNVNESPVSIAIAQKAQTVIDIIFNPQTTQLLKDAHSNINGVYMLVMQALKAEEIWQHKELFISVDELIDQLEIFLSFPKEIFEKVKNLPMKLDKVGCSQDKVYIFGNEYVLKISKNLRQLKREKERVDWLSNKIPGSRSIIFIEKDSIGYYLRSFIKGESLISKRFLDDPNLLIHTIQNVVQLLRGLDHMNCPFSSTDSIGTSFVHGDLCLPNIIVDKENRFCGFIDLDNAGLGDPYYDYAWLLWSFEYNLKTKQYNKLLLETLQISLEEDIYQKYIPLKELNKLRQKEEV